MNYMLLIYTPDIGRDRTDEEWAAMARPFIAYNEYVKASGFYVDGAPLAELSDGPFAETKEFLGGFYVLNCPTIDQAIELRTISELSC